MPSDALYDARIVQTTQPSKGQGYHVGDGETIALGVPSGTAHPHQLWESLHLIWREPYPSYPQRFLFLVLLIRVFLRSLLSRYLNSHYCHLSPPTALSAFAPLLLSHYFPSTFCPWFFFSLCAADVTGTSRAHTPL